MQTLESTLARAAADPAARPEFYRLLLASQIYVIGSARGNGRDSLAAGDGVALLSLKRADGATAIPFFTSVAALERTLKDESAYLAMPARALFDMTRGATLVLNPGSEYGKEFHPTEIATLLETGLNQVPSAWEVEDNTPVQLGLPAERPVPMLEALSRLLAKHQRVKAAYLCVMRNPSAGEHWSFVVGLEGDGDLFPVIQEAGSIVGDTAPTGAAVDFVAITRGQPGIANYMFTSVDPFYTHARKRSWRDGMRSLFGASVGSS